MKTERQRVRGGALYYTSHFARIASCRWFTPDDRNYALGLRLARDPMHKLAKAAKDEG